MGEVSVRFAGLDSQPPRVLDEHADLLVALHQGDAKKATRAMQAHSASGHRALETRYALNTPPAEKRRSS